MPAHTRGPGGTGVTTAVQVGVLVERRRSMSIRLYGLDQGWEDERFDALDEIVRLTRDVLHADGAGVNLLIDDLQVTVGSTTGPVEPVTRDRSICSTVLAVHHDADVVEIDDLREVPALAHHPAVDGSLASLRFYAAAPLVGKHGLALGTLCAWSLTTMHLDDQQRVMLRQLGRSVVNVLDERRRALVPTSAGCLRPAR